MTLPTPYYQSPCGRYTLYHGDCLEILPLLPSGSVDAVVSDVPYGVDFDYESHDDNEQSWYQLMNAIVPEMRRVAACVFIPSCRRTRMRWWYANHAPKWTVCWYKGSPGTRSPIGFADWEEIIMWGDVPVAMHDYFFAQPSAARQEGGRAHPCPKPVAWATWLVDRASIEDGIVLDPFCGSGTTGVACVRTGRRFIGIEIEERYCEIAARRIEAERNNLFAETMP